MKNNLLQLRETARQEISATKNLTELENIQIKYFGRKDGVLNVLLKSLKDLSPEAKKEVGQLANQVKVELEESLAKQKTILEKEDIASTLEQDRIDVTLPAIAPKKGSLNPTTLVQNELEDIFKSLGFMVLDGPELESDYYNFEALNIPEHHPARDMQDTFYIKGLAKNEKRVLRTHTSPVQVRAMQKYGAPLRAVAPGRVFRYEASDVSHDHTFYQLEGIMIDENISITNLIAVMKTLLRGILKRDVKVRLRPGFFPFVEPGFELDINCLICGGTGCSVCKQSGWVELLPCGMMHPSVLRAGNIDPEKYSGFAFGLGLTRLVMMKYGIDDIRLLNSGDLRFLKQF
ncbi:MAG: Phenylalanine-tRNA ligase alpha subunit [Parcubacteria group bacterium GW2011_GWC2_39_14]|nr:MAG: Phenylalanine-tRNA ligase alpha subunit [Parcubacteria group bacterium GW2011_GWC2_39_14]KKR55141.1 MAG: Phenylalanine-tRNA ligase alpha subunit [Parcubacteria group bacterium GW2011_GWA2_40_23]